MSYCRWSSDDWKSDLYVYESADGWCVHVAGARYEDVPVVDPKCHGATPEYMRQYEAQIDYVQKHESVSIDLPRAGESYRLSSPGETADLLESLAEEGFHVPDWVVPDLREEQKELDDDRR